MQYLIAALILFVIAVVSCVFEVLSLLLFLLMLVLYLPYSYIFKRSIESTTPIMSIDQMPVLRPLPMTVAAQKSSFFKFLDYLFVPRQWELIHNWHFLYEDRKIGKQVELVVPKGFVCDAASIPRPFRAFFNPAGLLLLPALLHDYGFEFNQLWQVDANGSFVPYGPLPGSSDKQQKRFWDDLLYEAGMQVNGTKLVNKVIWSIRGLTTLTWKKYRKESNVANPGALQGPSYCGNYP